MKEIVDITSLQNLKIKSAAKLFDRRDRDLTKLFLIEGYRELLRASKGGVVVKTLFFCPELFLGENEAALITSIQEKGAEIFRCDEKVFRKLSYRDRPDGLIAVAEQMQHTLAKLDAMLADQKDPLILVAEAIEKPGNLGTILRSCDAAGTIAAIVCDRCTDIYNPNVVRASVGTLFTLPVVEASSKDTLAWLRKKGFNVLAATPSADCQYTNADLLGPLAIVVGTEQLGLTRLWLDQADITVRIPMQGAADSLNVATATTLLLYEALRQRGLQRSL